MRLISTFPSILMLFIVVSFSSQAQTIGKIITSSEADVLFGKVLESKQLKASLLDSLMMKTKESAMFVIKENCVAIKGDGGAVIFNDGVKIEPATVFMKYSKKIVEELLTIKKVEFIFLEKRKDVLTLTAGKNTLEFGTPCPPNCD